MATTRSQARLAYLDSLRGVAALAVVACHYIQNYGMPKALAVLSFTPIRACFDGAAAVQLFFVLSGFVLALPHFRVRPRPQLEEFALGRFLVARAARIWLPYVAALALSLLCRHVVIGSISAHPTPTGSLTGWWLKPVTFSSIAHQVVLIRTSSPGDPRFALIPQGWSLANEMICSCLVPACVLLAARGTVWLLLAAGVAVECAGLSPVVGSFALGILIAKYFGRVEEYRTLRTEVRAILAFTSIILYTSSPWTEWAGWPVGRQVLMMTLGAAGIIISLLLSPLAQKLLSGRYCTHVGRISYSVYLIHVAVLITIVPFVRRLLDDLVGMNAAWWLGLAVLMATVLLMSNPMYIFVEVRSIHVGRWLADRLDFIRSVGMKRVIREHGQRRQTEEVSAARTAAVSV